MAVGTGEGLGVGAAVGAGVGVVSVIWEPAASGVALVLAGVLDAGSEEEGSSPWQAARQIRHSARRAAIRAVLRFFFMRFIPFSPIISAAAGESKREPQKHSPLVPQGANLRSGGFHPQLDPQGGHPGRSLLLAGGQHQGGLAAAWLSRGMPLGNPRQTKEKSPSDWMSFVYPEN